MLRRNVSNFPSENNNEKPSKTSKSRKEPEVGHMQSAPEGISSYSIIKQYLATTVCVSASVLPKSPECSKTQDGV